MNTLDFLDTKSIVSELPPAWFGVVTYVFPSDSSFKPSLEGLVFFLEGSFCRIFLCGPPVPGTGPLSPLLSFSSAEDLASSDRFLLVQIFLFFLPSSFPGRRIFPSVLLFLTSQVDCVVGTSKFLVRYDIFFFFPPRKTP